MTRYRFHQRSLSSQAFGKVLKAKLEHQKDKTGKNGIYNKLSNSIYNDAKHAQKKTKGGENHIPRNC